MSSASRICVIAGDLGGVDAGWKGPYSPGWVEAGESAAGIANKAMENAEENAGRPGDLSAGVDARWMGVAKSPGVYVEAVKVPLASRTKP